MCEGGLQKDRGTGLTVSRRRVRKVGVQGRRDACALSLTSRGGVPRCLRRLRGCRGTRTHRASSMHFQ